VAVGSGLSPGYGEKSFCRGHLVMIHPLGPPSGSSLNHRNYPGRRASTHPEGLEFPAAANTLDTPPRLPPPACPA
jgi:hypothetical protein